MTVPTCSRVPHNTFYSAATLECHAAVTIQEIPPSHIIQTHDEPVVILSVDAGPKPDVTTSCVVIYRNKLYPNRSVCDALLILLF